MLRFRGINEDTDTSLLSLEEKLAKRALIEQRRNDALEQSKSFDQYKNALVLQSEGEYSLAKSMYEEIVHRIDEKSSSSTSSVWKKLEYLCLKNIGMICEKCSCWNDALDHLVKSLLIDDTDPTLWYHVGLNSLRCGRLDISKSSFLKCLEFNPTHHQCRRKYIETLYYRNEYVECLKEIDRAIRVNPNGYDEESEYYMALKSFIFDIEPMLGAPRTIYDDSSIIEKYSNHMNQLQFNSKEIKRRLYHVQLSLPYNCLEQSSTTTTMLMIDGEPTWENVAKKLMECHSMLHRATKKFSIIMRNEESTIQVGKPKRKESRKSKRISRNIREKTKRSSTKRSSKKSSHEKLLNTLKRELKFDFSKEDKDMDMDMDVQKDEKKGRTKGEEKNINHQHQQRDEVESFLNHTRDHPMTIHTMMIMLLQHSCFSSFITWTSSLLHLYLSISSIIMDETSSSYALPMEYHIWVIEVYFYMTFGLPSTPPTPTPLKPYNDHLKSIFYHIDLIMKHDHFLCNIHPVLRIRSFWMIASVHDIKGNTPVAELYYTKCMDQLDQLIDSSIRGGMNQKKELIETIQRNGALKESQYRTIILASVGYYSKRDIPEDFFDHHDDDDGIEQLLEYAQSSSRCMEFLHRVVMEDETLEYPSKQVEMVLKNIMFGFDGLSNITLCHTTPSIVLNKTLIQSSLNDLKDREKARVGLLHHSAGRHVEAVRDLAPILLGDYYVPPENEQHDHDDDHDDHPFNIGDVVFAYDKHGKLYDAKIINVDYDGLRRRYHVHYQGWADRFNEWVSPSRIVRENHTNKTFSLPPLARRFRTIRERQWYISLLNALQHSLYTIGDTHHWIICNHHLLTIGMKGDKVDLMQNVLKRIENHYQPSTKIIIARCIIYAHHQHHHHLYVRCITSLCRCSYAEAEYMAHGTPSMHNKHWMNVFKFSTTMYSLIDSNHSLRACHKVQFVEWMIDFLLELDWEEIISKDPSKVQSDDAPHRARHELLQCYLFLYRVQLDDSNAPKNWKFRRNHRNQKDPSPVIDESNPDQMAKMFSAILPYIPQACLFEKSPNVLESIRNALVRIKNVFPTPPKSLYGQSLSQIDSLLQIDDDDPIHLEDTTTTTTKHTFKCVYSNLYFWLVQILETSSLDEEESSMETLKSRSLLYRMDLCVNPTRHASWAGLGFIYEQMLNLHQNGLSYDDDAPLKEKELCFKCTKRAVCCFQKAIQHKPPPGSDYTDYSGACYRSMGDMAYDALRFSSSSSTNHHLRMKDATKALLYYDHAWDAGEKHWQVAWARVKLWHKTHPPSKWKDSDGCHNVKHALTLARIALKCALEHDTSRREKRQLQQRIAECLYRWHAIRLDYSIQMMVERKHHEVVDHPDEIINILQAEEYTIRASTQMISSTHDGIILAAAVEPPPPPPNTSNPLLERLLQVRMESRKALESCSQVCGTSDKHIYHLARCWCTLKDPSQSQRWLQSIVNFAPKSKRLVAIKQRYFEPSQKCSYHKKRYLLLYFEVTKLLQDPEEAWKLFSKMRKFSETKENVSLLTQAAISFCSNKTNTLRHHIDIIHSTASESPMLIDLEDSPPTPPTSSQQQQNDPSLGLPWEKSILNETFKQCTEILKMAAEGPSHDATTMLKESAQNMLVTAVQVFKILIARHGGDHIITPPTGSVPFDVVYAWCQQRFKRRHRKRLPTQEGNQPEKKKARKKFFSV